MTFIVSPYRFGGGGGGGFGASKTITIDHTKVGASNSTDFPLLVSGTYAYLATVAHGGSVQNASGFDVGFYSDAGLTSKLDWETVRWVDTTGEVVYWVRVPTVSHTVDTVIYLGYGNAAITTDQSNATGVWDTATGIVHHLEDGSSLSLADATSNGNNGTGTGSPAATTGKVGGGASLDTSSYYHLAYTAAGGSPVSNGTVSFWVKKIADGATNGLFSWAGAPTSGTPFILIQDDNGTLKFYVDSNYRETSQTLTTGVWVHLAVTLATDTTWKFYLNASLLSTYSGGVSNRNVGDNVYVGTGFNGFGNAAFDEVRVARTTRSPDWITAEYNNQSSPSTFYAVT